MRQEPRSSVTKNAPPHRELRVEIDTAIRKAMENGLDEADACQQVTAIVCTRMNKLNACRSFKMVIQ